MNTQTIPRDAAALDAATPVDRDRVVDLLRLFSIAVVVIGHWMMAAVVWRPTGTEVDNAIRHTPGLWLLTWVLQVMPLFFFVGGFSHRVAWASVKRRSGGYADFVAGRVARLMRPTVVFLAVWLVAGPLLEAATGPRIGTAARDIARPLWFLGVYLIAVAVAPAMLRVHERFGWRAPVAMLGGAVVVDALSRGAHVPAVGVLNFALVWLFAHQLGFFYADGTLLRMPRRALWIAAAASLGALAVLVGSGLYPGSMVGMPGEQATNNSPPTICLSLLSVWLVALAMLLRPWLARVAARPRAWRAIVAGNSVIMTLFLWHLTAMLAGATIWHTVGLPEPAPSTGAFHAWRPAWVALMAVLLAPLVVAFGRFEPVRTRVVAPGRARVLVAQVLLVAGLAGFAVGGFSHPFTAAGRAPIGLPVYPALSAVLVAAGLLLMGLRPTPQNVSPRGQTMTADGNAPSLLSIGASATGVE